jgi:hypothetical protein
MKDGLSKLQRRILTQALTPSPAAIKGNSAHMEFIPADAWPDHRPSASERASLSRALRRLETRGLLACFNGVYSGNKRVGWKLTDYGRIVATNLSTSQSGS